MKILRSREWNGRQYHKVQLDDGTVVELKCSIGEVVGVVEKLSRNQDTQPTMPQIEMSDDQLMEEIKRRKLAVIVKGEAK